MIGELKNTNNKLDKRIMRVLARTPLNNIFFTLYLFFFKKKIKRITLQIIMYLTVSMINKKY